MLFLFIFLIVTFHPANCFIFEKSSAPLSDLSYLIEAQSNRRLSVGLDIGQPGDISRLAINGIVFDLTKCPPSSNDDVVKMPGVHGPNSSLSGGLRMLTTVQDGSFISMTGSEIVKPLKGCWEIIWKEGAPSGSILCGFEIDQDYKRNDATLPKGIVYVSFNTWDAKGLKQVQDIKDRSAIRASKALREKDEELTKMAETSNVLQKARHYYNALSAAEVYSKQSNRVLKLIPASDDVIDFGENVHVSRNGLVWTQYLPKGKPIILGKAMLKSSVKDIVADEFAGEHQV